MEPTKGAPIYVCVASDGMEVSGPNRESVKATMLRHINSHPGVTAPEPKAS